MATKERFKIIKPGAHTIVGVRKYASDYGLKEQEAWDYLAQYALNRIATLARNAAKKPAKPKKEKKPKAAKPAKAPKAPKKPKAAKPEADKVAA